MTPLTLQSLLYKRCMLLPSKEAKMYSVQAHSLKCVVFLLDGNFPSPIFVFVTKVVNAQAILVAAEPVPPTPHSLLLFCSLNILETLIVAHYPDACVFPICIRITQLILSTLHNYSSICKFLISHRVF